MTERRYYDDKLQAWVTVCPPGHRARGERPEDLGAAARARPVRL